MIKRVNRRRDKRDEAALTSHFDSARVSPGFSPPAGLAGVGDRGSGGGMGIGRGMGWLWATGWPSGLSGPTLDVGWPMITMFPVGLEHENTKTLTLEYEHVKSVGEVTDR